MSTSWSYTGSVSTVTKEELKLYKGQNLLHTLSNIDASINMAVDNLAGSNPNTLPQINIRGNASLPMNVQEFNETNNNSINTPLIIMDGFEISLTTLMDYNDEEIESINILKDAAATAIYGSRGANGVVVIVSKKPESGKLRINLETGVNLEVPDLTSYDLLNASEKLMLENAVGLYSSDDPEKNQAYQKRYNQRLRSILEGTDTDWLSKPLHVGVGQRYNLRMEGGNDEFRWSMSGSYNDTQGAMKDSYRRTFTGGITLLYQLKNVLFRNYTSVAVNHGRESKYGTFDTYVKQQPYNSPYDEEGNLKEKFDGFYADSPATENPLYDASLNSFDKSNYQTLSNNFSVEWTILSGLLLRGQFGISNTVNESDHFLPKSHSYFTTTEDYATEEDYFRRGLYEYGTGKDFTYNGNLTFSYNKLFKEVHSLYVGLDLSLAKSNTYHYDFVLEGFSSENASFLANARQYAKEQVPSGTKSLDHRVGVAGNINYTYNNKYYVDFSYRMDGNSAFGSNKKYAPFWSTGIGWNLHREKFLEDHPVLNTLRLKVSFGETGSLASSDGAETLYKYSMSDKYLNWSGAQLSGLGNKNLSWQKTWQSNFGVEFGLWENRLKGSFDWYTKNTSNLLSSMDMPLSMGFSSYTANVGKVKNSGFEASLSGFVIRNEKRDLSWIVSGQLVYNKNEIIQLSEEIKAQTEAWLQEDVEVSKLFYEGRPQNAIYAVRSLGIDPSTGDEIFLNKDGEITKIWSPSDKVYLGPSEPLYRGNASTMLSWKGLTFNIAFSFYWGGKVYNSTLRDRVEVGKTAITESNVDARVLNDRWHQPGDVTFFKRIEGNSSTRATSRYVMDDNVFKITSVGLQYKWSSPVLRKYAHIQTVTFGLNMSDLLHLSSIRMERGINYPFARNIQGSIRLLF